MISRNAIWANSGKKPTGCPLTWTKRTPHMGTSWIYGAEYANGYWIIVGGNSAAAWATDPTGLWTSMSVGMPPALEIYNIVYGGGYWVAVAEGGNLTYTVDPTGRSGWVVGAPAFFPDAVMGVAYGDGHWVIGGKIGRAHV